MTEYFNDTTAITLELLLLSGGTTVTGRIPYVEVRDKHTGNYFDFNSRTFTSVTVSSTAPLASAIDGLYRITWDVSGLFTTSHYLMAEYHDSTALGVEDIIFRTLPVTTADANVTAAGGGNITITGNFTAKDRDNLKDVKMRVEDIQFKITADVLPILRGLLAKSAIEKSDIQFLKLLKEKNAVMWGELLKILKLRDDSTTKAVISKLDEYLKKDEKDKKEVLKLLEDKLKPASQAKKIVDEDDEDE